MSQTAEITPARAYAMGRNAAYEGDTECPFSAGSAAAKNWNDGQRDVRGEDRLKADPAWG